MKLRSSLRKLRHDQYDSRREHAAPSGGRNGSDSNGRGDGGGGGSLLSRVLCPAGQRRGTAALVAAPSAPVASKAVARGQILGWPPTSTGVSLGSMKSTRSRRPTEQGNCRTPGPAGGKAVCSRKFQIRSSANHRWCSRCNCGAGLAKL